MKTNTLAFGNVATMAVLAVTLAAVLVTGANADAYHHPYHHYAHRVAVHHYAHPVSHHFEKHDEEHPHR